MKANGQVGAIGLCGQSVFLHVDHFHQSGETLRADTIYAEPGGKAYNQAVAAHRLGARTLFFGAIGNDESGRMCRAHLDSEGICSFLSVKGSASTAYACILTDAAGDNHVTVYSGAATSLSAEDILSWRKHIAECTVLLLGLECPLDVTCAALELAKEYGVYSIFNPAPALKMDLKLLKQFDLITPNAQEASVLLGTSETDCLHLCEAAYRAGLERAVITLGADGVLFYEQGRAFRYPAVDSTAVDTTGAGDCFSGALAAALVSGSTLESAIVFASNAAALSVRRHHVMTSLPELCELKANYIRIAPEKIWETPSLK